VLDTHPIDPLTGAPYTDDAWRAAVAGLISRVRDVAGADALIVIAGMGGSDELRAGGAELSALADVTLLRPFAGDAASWLDDVNAATELAIGGRGVIAYAPGAPASSSELQERIDCYAFASYLLTLEAGPAYYGQTAPGDAPPEGYATQPSYRLAPLGKPLGQRHQADGVEVRLFERGTVIVNPDDVAHDVPLPGRYHSPDGAAVAGHIVLAPHDAALLVNDQ